MAREASGKYAISTAPSTASNSSSASSRLSWQPSQDANLKTATLGFAFGLGFFLELIFIQQRSNSLVRKHGSVFADEIWAILAMSTETDAALHVAFHGNVNVFSFEPLHLQFACHKPHHDLGTTNHRDGARRLKPRILK